MFVFVSIHRYHRSPLVLLFVLLMLVPFQFDQAEAKKHEKFKDEIKSITNFNDAGISVAFKYHCIEGFCGCVVAQKNQYGSISGGDVPQNFVYPTAQINCPHQFYKIALMSMCGNEWYDQMKYCALAHFFDDKNPDEANVENDPYKKTLILIDGCVVHNKGICKLTRIRVTHHEKGGGFFSKCKEEPEHEALNVNNFELDMPSGGKLNHETGAFTVPVVLTHRVCQEVFGEPVVEEVYNNLKLHLTFDGECGEKTIDLPDVDLKAAPFNTRRIGELRGLMVNIDGENKQHRRKSSTGPGNVEYFEDGNLMWEDPNLNQWVKK